MEEKPSFEDKSSLESWDLAEERPSLGEQGLWRMTVIWRAGTGGG